MPDSYPFPMYSGLLEPEHYKKIGSAIWLFLWCVSSTTSEKEKDGIVWGIVLGNKPMKLSDMAEKFGVNDKTVSRWLDALEINGYIRVTRAPRGLIISVKNSKKWTDKNVRSQASEQTHLSDHIDSEQTNVSDQPDKNVRSNKDITEILIDRWIDGLEQTDAEELKLRTGVLSSAVGSVSTGQIVLDQPTIEQRALQIENYFLKQKGAFFPVAKDLEHVCEVASEPMPLEFAYFGIDLAIARHKLSRRRPTDKVRSFAYCKTVIFGCWDQLTDVLGQSQTTLVPSSGVSRRHANTVPSSKPVNRQQTKNEIAAQKIREAEERDRIRSSENIYAD